MALLSVQAQRYFNLGEVPQLSGNMHPIIAPYGVFETLDGPINLAPATHDMWLNLCRLLDLDHLATDPRFIDNVQRLQHVEQLTVLIESRLKLRKRADWTSKLLEVGIPAGPINDLADVFAAPQVRHCQLVESVLHPVLGPLQQLASPITMDTLRGRTVRSAPPQLGEHTRAVLTDFGLEQQQIEQLLRDGVVKEHEGFNTRVDSLRHDEKS